jgi:hypothetical protein
MIMVARSWSDTSRARRPQTGGDVAELAKGSRITGTQRTELATELAQRYGAGESIRAIAEATGRSFGFVHGLIKESGVEVRGRGGATRGAAAAKVSDRPASTATGAPDATSKPKAAAVKPDKKAKAKKSDKSDDSKKSKKGKKR